MTSKMQAATKAVANGQILEVLSDYTPEVVSTIYVGFDAPESDIDIVCYHADFSDFQSEFSCAYSSCDGYAFSDRGVYAVGRFWWDNFLVEVFVSRLPVRSQPTYRHFKLMQRLSRIGGEEFRERVRAERSDGLKTEAVLCSLLGLSGDPCRSILEIEI